MKDGFPPQFIPMEMGAGMTGIRNKDEGRRMKNDLQTSSLAYFLLNRRGQDLDMYRFEVV